MIDKTSHLYGATCDQTWSEDNDLSRVNQTSHVKGFSPLCILECTLIELEHFLVLFSSLCIELNASDLRI